MDTFYERVYNRLCTLIRKECVEDGARIFVKLAKNKLENMNYKVYLKGERFVLENANRIVDENEYLIAIK